MIDGMSIYDLLRLQTEIAAEIRKRERPRGGTGLDKANRKKLARVPQRVLEIMDRRRFIIGPVPSSRTRNAPEGTTGTVYPDKVQDPDGSSRVLKDGKGVQKLGGDVLVGELRGAKLVYLALEERATCPRSCAWWDGCYTNNMPLLVRYRHGPDLVARIREEVGELLRKHDMLLVRLHMAGDFYSVDYVLEWWRLLRDFPGLFAFGFTAWREDTRIGEVIGQLRDQMGDRFNIRTSGRTGRWGSFTVPLMAEDRAMIGDAVVCPEQRDAMRGFTKFTHCGSCGLCWKGGREIGRPIAFIEH